jgi:hypothetical protein
LCIQVFALSGVLLGVARGPVGAQEADPFHCQPPMGQPLYEIRVRNTAAQYREEPTAANKAKMCTAYAAAVRVFRSAVDACQKSSCEEEAFRDVCAKREQKLAELTERQRSECGRAAR